MVLKWRWLRRLCGYYEMEDDFEYALLKVQQEREKWEREYYTLECHLISYKVSTASSLYTCRTLLSQWVKNAELNAKRELNKGDCVTLLEMQFSKDSLIERTKRHIQALTTYNQEKQNAD